MLTVKDILQDAKKAPLRGNLEQYREAIVILRGKNYTWREIANFLKERGVEADHTKVFRFMQKEKGKNLMTIEFVVPDAANYAKALLKIKISENQKQMLGFHYHAHNRTVTYTELAQAAGYEDFRTANIQYGKLGRALGEALNMQLLPSQSRDEPFYSSSIGTDNPWKPKDEEYQLVMHHELAKAIAELGWFD